MIIKIMIFKYFLQCLWCLSAWVVSERWVSVYYETYVNKSKCSATLLHKTYRVSNIPKIQTFMCWKIEQGAKALCIAFATVQSSVL